MLTDRAFALGLACHPAYSRVGDWIVPERGTRVLELGCANGKYVALLSTLGFEIVGVDPLRFPEWEEIADGRPVTFMGGVYAESLPFEDLSFDHIFCGGALFYFDDPAKALDEMRRVIKPTGRLVLRTVNRDNPYTRRTGLPMDPATKKLHTMDELVQLVEDAGFVVADRFTYGYAPPYCQQLWWYLVSVWLPFSWQEWLSDRLPEGHRSGLTIFATPK